MKRRLCPPGQWLLTSSLSALLSLPQCSDPEPYAADLEGAPPPGPFSNWSGPYIGVGITARYNAVDANVRAASVGTPAMPIPLPSVSEASSNSLTFWSAGPGAHQFIDNIAMGARVYGGWNY